MNNSKGSRAAGLLAAALGVLVAGPVAAQVKVTDAWAAATATGATRGQLYLTLENPGEEQRKLMKMVTPVADSITVHLTSITEQGTPRLWPMALLAVDPGQTVKMQPGGLLVTLGALKAPLVAGQRIPVTMKFDGGEPEFTVMVDVRPAPAATSPRAQR